MIKINGMEVKVEHYPDGTPRINVDSDKVLKITDENITVQWKYESDAELMYLMFIKQWIDENFYSNDRIVLQIYYVPNARMDRICNYDEVFTLKYFCKIINSLHFSAVAVLDVHSNVTPALLDNCINLTPKNIIQNVIDEIKKENMSTEEVTNFLDIKNGVVSSVETKMFFNDSDLVLYFPDAGAAKRYGDMFSEYKYCFGEKKRDWNTGKIIGLDIKTNGIDLKDKVVLMIDDIISYGGSLYYSANTLKENGVGKIYAYATHTENSILDKEKGTLIKSLENNTVEKLYTTDSLYSGNHEKIQVMEVMKK